MYFQSFKINQRNLITLIYYYKKHKIIHEIGFDRQSLGLFKNIIKYGIIINTFNETLT